MSHPYTNPCFLNGCDLLMSSDGSQTCRQCGRFYGPDHSMVNALLRVNAGGKVYRDQAIALGYFKVETPLSPPIQKPIEPPLAPASEPMELWEVVSLSALCGALAGLWLWSLVVGIL